MGGGEEESDGCTCATVRVETMKDTREGWIDGGQQVNNRINKESRGAKGVD